MSLDISTLLLLTIAMSFGLGMLSIGFSFLQAGTRGSRHWGVGMIGLGTGYALMYVHPSLASHALLYAGWICVLLSVLLMSRALHRICQQVTSRTLFGTAVIGGAIAGWLFFTYAVPSPLARTNTMSAALSLITGRAAWDLWRFARSTRYRAPAFAAAALLAVATSTPLVEILLRETAGGATESAMEYGPTEVIFARVLIIAFLSMSVLWLEISRLYETMEDQATHDELTGVSSRRAVLAQAQRELARAQREKSPCSIAVFDVDFFKRVNDTWGHPVGDEVLKWVTRVIGRNIRAYDTLGRYGGEEFMLVMPGTDASGALAIVDRARIAVGTQACVVDAIEIRISVSAGIATSSEGEGLDALLLSADDALYRAKEGGRNRVVVADPVPAINRVAVA